MSRTYKKDRSTDYYHADRAGNLGEPTPRNSYAKKLTHKKERKQNKINPRFIEEEDNNA